VCVINNKTAGDPKHWGKGYATAMIYWGLN